MTKLAKLHTPAGQAITEIILTVFRLNGRLLRAGDALGKDLGLSSARWQVLGVLNDRPRTVAQVARHFESTRQGVLWVVNALEKDGLVELIDNPEHKRAKIARLTSRGQKSMADMQRRQALWVNGLGEHLSEAEVRAASSMLERLRGELAD